MPNRLTRRAATARAHGTQSCECTFTVIERITAAPPLETVSVSLWEASAQFVSTCSASPSRLFRRL